MTKTKPIHYVMLAALVVALAGWFFRYESHPDVNLHTDRWTGETCILQAQC